MDSGVTIHRGTHMLDEIRSATRTLQGSPTAGPWGTIVEPRREERATEDTTRFERAEAGVGHEFDRERDIGRIWRASQVSAYSGEELSRLGHSADHAKTARSMLWDYVYDSPDNLALADARLGYAKDALDDALAALDGDGIRDPDQPGRFSEARATILDGLRRIEAAQASLERLKQAQAALDEAGGPGSFAAFITGAEQAFDDARKAFRGDLASAAAWGRPTSGSPYEPDPLDFAEEPRFPHDVHGTHGGSDAGVR